MILLVFVSRWTFQSSGVFVLADGIYSMDYWRILNQLFEPDS